MHREVSTCSESQNRERCAQSTVINCFLKLSRCHFGGEVVFTVSLALSSPSAEALKQCPSVSSEVCSPGVMVVHHSQFNGLTVP